MGWYISTKENPEVCAAVCRICSKEIGETSKFYFEDAKSEKCVHAVCLWKEVDENQKKMRAEV